MAPYGRQPALPAGPRIPPAG